MSYCERFFNFDVFRNEMPISIVSKINIIRKYILTSYIHIYTLLYSLISKNICGWRRECSLNCMIDFGIVV